MCENVNYTVQERLSDHIDFLFRNHDDSVIGTRLKSEYPISESWRALTSDVNAIRPKEVESGSKFQRCV